MKTGSRRHRRGVARVRVALVALLALIVAGPAAAQRGVPDALGRPDRTRVDKMWRLKVPTRVVAPCVTFRYPTVEVVVPRAALERIAYPNAPAAPSQAGPPDAPSHAASAADAAAILQAAAPAAHGACAVVVVDPATRAAQDRSRIVGSLIEAGVAGVRDLASGAFVDRIVVHYIDETGMMCCGGYTTYSLSNNDQPFLQFSRWIS